LGTVDASLHVPAPAKATDNNPTPHQAGTALEALEKTLTITPSRDLSSTATIDVTDTGFPPGHQATIPVDDRTPHRRTAARPGR
jgi:hypothetical protein